MASFDFRWASIDPGRLALWHRPKLRAIPYLQRAGCDRVVTLLSGREGGEGIGRAVQEAGLEWSWIPLPGGHPPEGSVSRIARAGLALLSERLDAGESILLHCSAGMHRTGMMAYALLRQRGFSPESSLEVIEEIRPVTRQALNAAQLAWGDDLVTDQPSMDHRP